MDDRLERPGTFGNARDKIRRSHRLYVGPRDRPTCFDGKATVTSDAFVMCNFTKADGERELGAFVGGLDDIEANVTGLAQHLELTATEREEFAKVLEGWIAMEYCDGKARLRRAATKGIALH